MSVVPDLSKKVRSDITRFTADGAYDTKAVYDLMTEGGATVVVTPIMNARTSRGSSAGDKARNATVQAIDQLGRREWKKNAGYHQQSRVENAIYRYKTIIGGALKSRNTAGQATEVTFAVNILNRLLELGAPRSEPIYN